MAQGRALVLPYRVLSGTSRDAFILTIERQAANTELIWLDADGLDGLTERVASLRPDVLVVGGTTQALEARELAPDSPIVAWGVGTEVAGARPRGLTGVAPSRDLFDRRLDLMLALLPDARDLALAYDDRYRPGRVALPRARESARIRGVTTHVYEARRGEDIVPAVVRAAGDGRSAMFVMNSPILGRADMAEAALRARLPLFGYDWTTRAGGLASVTPDFREVARTMATQVAAILTGALADDIPLVEQTTFWTAVNVATAEHLAVSIPEAVLARASEVVR